MTDKSPTKKDPYKEIKKKWCNSDSIKTNSIDEIKIMCSMDDIIEEKLWIFFNLGENVEL